MPSSHTLQVLHKDEREEDQVRKVYSFVKYVERHIPLVGEEPIVCTVVARNCYLNGIHELAVIQQWYGQYTYTAPYMSMY